MNGNYFAYLRISTKEASDKQSFARQIKGLENYAKNNHIEYTLQMKDDITGSTFERPEWKKLEKLLKSGDTIVFKEISRFTREAEIGYKKYMELMNKGINLIFIDNPTVSTDYIRNLTMIAEGQSLVTKTALEGTIKLLLIVELDRVEQEREIIVKRIKQGMEASDKKPGRKPGTKEKLTKELEEDIRDYIKNGIAKGIKQVDLMKKHKVSRNTLKSYVRGMLNNISEEING